MIPTRRPVVGADREFLWKLHRAAMRPHVEATWGWSDADQRARFDAAFRTANTEILELDGAPIGMIEVIREPGEWFLARMALLPETQGKGIGTVLLRELCAEADAGGVPVRLQVLLANPAHRLYTKSGFEVVEITATHRRMVRRPASR